MTAPPDRLFYDPKLRQTFLTAPGIEYVPKAAIADAEARGREQAADHFAALAEATPLGAENKERGASVYNWTRWAEKQVRALIPAPPADGGEKPEA